MSKFSASLTMVSASLVVVLVLASSAFATPVVTSVSSSTQLSTSTANDLILNPSSTFNSSSLTGAVAYGAFNTLNDGLFPDATTGGNLPLSVGLSNGSTATYLLNTAAHPQGYDINSFVSVSAWTDGRVGQNYSLYYTTLTNSTPVLISPVAIEQTGGSLAVTIADTSGVLAQHVASIEVVVSNNTRDNDETIYQEFVLNGVPSALSTPEPSTVILGGIGAMGLLIAARRRRV
jgi:hypothetical protein